jgi:class 3 adenylate cyclase
MQAAVQSLIAEWKKRGYALGFGIGLAKGIATVGRIGYEGRHDYTAVGRVANLASRLCSAAEDRQILVDANLASAVTGAVALTQLGTRELKGFGESVAVSAVAAKAAAE